MAFEDRLRSALEDAVKFCNSGSTPDEAVCKSAAAAGFNKDQTDRLVETLNTAITINQYKQAADKTKSFPIAHKDKVAGMMLDANKVLGVPEKKAEVQHIYFEYMKPAYDYVKHADDVEIKAAGSEDKLSGLSLDNLAYLSIQQMKLVKNAADYANNVAGVIKGSLVTKLYELADQVKKAGVEKYARLKVALGDNHEVVKNLNKVLPAKFAEASCKDSLVDDSDLVELEKTASDMSEDIASMKEMREQARVMNKQAADMEAQINDAFVEKKEGPSTFFGLFKSAMPSVEGQLLDRALDNYISMAKKTDSLDKQKTKLEAQNARSLESNKKLRNQLEKLREQNSKKDPGFLDYVYGSQDKKDIGGAVSLSPFRELEDLFFKSRADENDETIRTIENVKRSIMLEDLMMNDPVIADADPDVVTDVYKSLIQTSPGVANNKEVVRSILRQAINSIAISPYDANTWADLEKKQKDATRSMQA